MEEQKKMKAPQETIRLVENATTLNLVIPESVEAKIRHLCSRVHDVEWSGTLFYKVEGSFDDGTFKATCLDICVMDIGTAGFTNYDDTADIVAYRIDHPELLEEGVYEGLVHSHNRMATFFSGTDTNTLLSEGSDLNHFLSLIVNNAGTYTARVTRKLVRKVKAEAHVVYTESSYYKSYNDVTITTAENKVTEKDQSQEKKETVVEWFNLAIDKATVDEPFSELDQRLADIRKAKTKVKTTYTPISTPGYGYNGCKPSKPSTPSKPAYSTLVNTPAKNLNKEPIQGTLFPESEEQETTSVPLSIMEQVDEKVTRNLCTQLLLGSILVDTDRINLESWVRKMDDLYVKRFGDLNNQDNCQNLESWIGLFVEKLITESNDPAMEDRVLTTYGEEYDESDFAQLYAFEMIRFLYDLPDSAVKELMIDELKTYIPNELEEYI